MGRSQNTLIVSLIALGLLAACDQLSREEEPPEKGKRGESCTSGAECGGGLACVMAVCVLDEFPVVPTAKSCDYVECSDGNPSACYKGDDTAACVALLDDCVVMGNVDSCVSYRGDCEVSAEAVACAEQTCVSRCQDDAHCCPNKAALARHWAASATLTGLEENLRDVDAGASPCDVLDVMFARSVGELLGCGCQVEDYKCGSEGTCSARCADDDDCFLGRRCASGTCVRCLEDTDCFDDQRCDNLECVQVCQNDTNCPAFNACQGGNCEPTGCQDDRECIATSRSVLAFCRDGQCQVPCSSDLDCDRPQGFGGMACIDRVCTHVGCATDEECKILEAPLGQSGDGRWLCQ